MPCWRMKDLFSEFDFTKVGYFESVLEAQGIKTFIRNRDLAGLAGSHASLRTGEVGRVAGFVGARE